jgi:ribulose-5-phosphate 4-epimerase/fuculose-1-phosphate aldolase
MTASMDVVDLPRNETQICNAEDRLREDLSLAHKLMTVYGMDELIWNHISARLPGWSPSDFLITPGDRVWATMEPQHILRGSGNVTANVLHEAIYQGLPNDAFAVVHVHAPAIEAVSCLEEGVQFLSQTAANFFGRIAYHEWEGLSDDPEECSRIVKSLADVECPPALVLMMRNHGAITIGKTVAQATVAMFFLNRVCELQLKVLASGQKFIRPARSVMEKARDQTLKPEFCHGVEWEALREWVKASERGDVPPLMRSNL